MVLIPERKNLRKSLSCAKQPHFAAVPCNLKVWRSGEFVNSVFQCGELMGGVFLGLEADRARYGGGVNDRLLILLLRGAGQRCYDLSSSAVLLPKDKNETEQDSLV